MIYFGNTAQLILQKNLQDSKLFLCRGCFLENDTWIAFDNRNRECFVEEFATKEKAICWLESFFEISEIESFNILKLFKNLYLIPTMGLLKLNFETDTLSSKIYLLPFLR